MSSAEIPARHHNQTRSPTGVGVSHSVSGNHPAREVSRSSRSAVRSRCRVTAQPRAVESRRRDHGHQTSSPPVAVGQQQRQRRSQAEDTADQSQSSTTRTPISGKYRSTQPSSRADGERRIGRGRNSRANHWNSRVTATTDQSPASAPAAVPTYVPAGPAAAAPPEPADPTASTTRTSHRPPRLRRLTPLTGVHSHHLHVALVIPPDRPAAPYPAGPPTAAHACSAVHRGPIRRQARSASSRAT